MLKIFHSTGILPELKLLLKRSLSDEDIQGAQHLTNVAGILSGPVALLSSRERRICLTSSGEIVISLNGLQDVMFGTG